MNGPSRGLCGVRADDVRARLVAGHKPPKPGRHGGEQAVVGRCDVARTRRRLTHRASTLPALQGRMDIVLPTLLSVS